MSKFEGEPPSSRREDNSNGREARHIGGTPTNPSAPEYVDVGPGHILANRYELQDRLGTGGMGTVFRAWDRTLGTHIALKVLLPSFLNDKRALERFVNEVRLARKIRHPGVCSVHDFGEDGRTRFLTMELVEGRNLRCVVGEDRATIDQTYQYLRQIAQGLAAIHREGVVHRDLKPENVLVDPHGRTVIADFGIAKHAQQESHTVTKPGTPRYMSPEQLRGESIDVRSDIFSFGVMAFELLSGKFPFEGRSDADIASATLRDPPERFEVAGISSAVLHGLQVFLGRALAKEPQNRFPSAVEMSRAFDDAWPRTSSVEAQSSPETRTALQGSSPPQVSRRRWFFALFGITTALLAMIAVIAWRKSNANADWRPVLKVEPFPNASSGMAADTDDANLTKLLQSDMASSPIWRVAHEEHSDPPTPTLVVRSAVHRLGTNLQLVIEIHDGQDGTNVDRIEVDGTVEDTVATTRRARFLLWDALYPIAVQREREWKARDGTRNAQAREKLLEYWRVAGKVPSAEEHEKALLDEAIRFDSKYVPALVERARMLSNGVGVETYAIGNALALQDLETALEVAPGNSDAIVMRCRVLRFAVEIEVNPTDAAIARATAACNEAAKAIPNSARVHWAFAHLYDRQCQDDLSLKEFDRAGIIEPYASPDFKLVRHTLEGAVGVALNDRDLIRADVFSQRLVEIEPRWQNGHPVVRIPHLLRGGVLLQMGKLKEAKEEFLREIAVAQTPADVEDIAAESAAIRGLMRIAKQSQEPLPDYLSQRLEMFERLLFEKTSANRREAKEAAILYQWVDPEAALRFLEQHGAPNSFDDAFRRALFLHEANRDADAQKILEKYPATQEWERNCLKWMKQRSLPQH